MSETNKINIIFFGTAEFADIILKHLIENGYKPGLVVTTPDKPTGRKKELTSPPVKLTAEKEGIKVTQPEKFDDDFHSLIATHNSLFIVADYGKILPKKILDAPEHGTLNVHPSLLPRWRGPSPIQYTILHGDEVTGVSIILMDEKIDHGPLVAQQLLELPNADHQKYKNKTMDNITAPELRDVLAHVGGELLIETIPEWVSGNIDPQDQDHQNATYSGVILRDHGKIDWTGSALTIERKLRAFTPWPGIYTDWNNRKLKILNGRAEFPESQKKSSSRGIVKKYKNSFAVQAGEGIFVPEEVQLEGKNPVKSEEFLKGHPQIIGSRLR